MILYKYFSIGVIKINKISKVLEKISLNNSLIKFKSYKITNNNLSCFIICGYESKNQDIKLSKDNGDLQVVEDFVVQINKCPIIDINKIKNSYIKKLLDVRYIFNFKEYELNEISTEFKIHMKNMNLKSLLLFYLKLKKNYSKLLDVRFNISNIYIF